MIAAFFTVWMAVAPAAPVQRPDSAALRGVQDSLDRVRGAAYNFRTDLGRASPLVLYNRAQRMRTSCLAADRALVHLDSTLTAMYPAGTPAALRRAARVLRGALADCRRDYDTAVRWDERADSVRAWAPYRLRRLEEAMRSFVRAAVLPRR